MLAVLAVPRCAIKLRAVRFKVHFGAHAAELRKSLDLVVETSMQLRGSGACSQACHLALPLPLLVSEWSCRKAADGIQRTAPAYSNIPGSRVPSHVASVAPRMLMHKPLLLSLCHSGSSQAGKVAHLGSAHVHTHGPLCFGHSS
jgi:hypothetical protein